MRRAPLARPAFGFCRPRVGSFHRDPPDPNAPLVYAGRLTTLLPPRQQIADRRMMPLATARRPDAPRVQRRRDLAR